VFFAGFFLWVFGVAGWDCFVDAKLHRPSTIRQPFPGAAPPVKEGGQDGKEEAKG